MINPPADNRGMASRAAPQVTDYLAALGGCEDVACALRVGVERAAEAFGADAVIQEGDAPAFAVPTVSAALDKHTRLVLARKRPFTVEETALLEGMARALAQ